MDYYTEYLNSNIVGNIELLNAERKKQLRKIQSIRGKDRDIMVYASDLTKDAPITINYDDKLAFYDQIPKSNNKAIDIILETPGGFAEVVEDLIRNLRKKYSNIGVIVPGYAKSAGTIFAMGADEILMGDTSALGPIDAQIINQNGKNYSAGAFLEGLENIKRESKEKLEEIYKPILQNISPGEIEQCKNCQEFSQKIVKEWLVKYRFNNSNLEIAEEIAKELANNKRWKTHGKSLNIEDLRNLKLDITDFSEDEELNDAIMRYYTLMRMTFYGPIYKYLETIDTQIYKMLSTQEIIQPQNHVSNQEIKNVLVDVECSICKFKHKIVIPFDGILPENKEYIAYPKNNILFCTNCHNKMDLTVLKNEIENNFGKKIDFRKY